MDMTGDAASMMLTARTGTPVEAEQLESTLRGLQAFGGMLGRRKDEKSQALTRVVENLKITRAANEVQLQTAVPQTDFGKLF